MHYYQYESIAIQVTAHCRGLHGTMLVLTCRTAWETEYTARCSAIKRTVQGHVADAEGPIIGATIKEKSNPQNATVTDFDGNFTLRVSEGATLIVTYVGYKTQEVVVGRRNSLDIKLSTDDKSLEEVVVVGYGIQKKKLVTGATVEVKGDDIQKMNNTQVLGALQSLSPGVNIAAASGQPGDSYNINIRGAGTNSSTTPLYIIDGVAGGDINTLNPADIERIDVLKDAASCAIYGARAANGVIMITTKQGKQGKVQVSYDGYVGWQNVYKMPRLLNARQYMSMMDQMAVNSGSDVYDWSLNSATLSKSLGPCTRNRRERISS